MITRSVDSETLLINPSCKAPRVVCITDCVKVGSVDIWHQSSPPPLAKWLKEDRLIFAHASFDLAVFCERWPELTLLVFDALAAGRIICIQLNEMLNDIESGKFRGEENEHGEWNKKGYSLFELVYRHLGVKLEKDEFRMNYHDRLDLPLDEWPAGAKKYACDDAETTLAVFERQPLHPYAGEATAADFALYLMSCYGSKTDAVQTAKMKAVAEEELKGLRKDLVKLKWVWENPKTASGWSVREKDVKDYALSVLPSDYKKTKTGEKLEVKGGEALAESKLPKYLSLAAKHLTDCSDKKLKTFVRYKQIAHLLNGPVKQMEAGVVVPVSPRFTSILATGRTSSSGPNTHNCSKQPGMRECYIARAGCALVGCDYDSAELHTWAQICYDQFGFSDQGDALNAGIDPHSVVGALIRKVSYEDFLPKKGEGKERDFGKIGNFGFIGGMGFKRYADNLGISLEFAEEIFNAWLDSWREARLYRSWIGESGVGSDDKRRYSASLPKYGLHFANRSFCQAANVRFQALAAVGAKRALVQLTRDAFDRKSVFYGCRPLNMPHDEIVSEIPLEKLDPAARHMRRVMEECFTTVTPDFPATCDMAAMFSWSKKAEGIYNAGGELIPWELRATS